MEEIREDFVSNPLITWGIIISTLGAFQDNFTHAPERLGFEAINIGINFPFEEETPTAIVLGLGDLEVQNMGFYSAELTEPRNQLLKSTGEITVDIYTPNHNNMMTMVDYITQCYLMNLFDKSQLAHPGAERSYVAIGYGGGKLRWSGFELANPPFTEQKLWNTYKCSTSFAFVAEHHLSTDLARVSAIDIEAVPLNIVVD